MLVFSPLFLLCHFQNGKKVRQVIDYIIIIIIIIIIIKYAPYWQVQGLMEDTYVQL